MLLKGLGQIAVPVDDLDRAARFYGTTLGLPHLFTVPGQLAFFDAWGTRIMLSLPEKDFDKAASVLYFRVDDIHAAYTQFRERGVDFVDAPHMIANMGTYELWMAFFRDGEKSIHALMCEIPIAKP